jgi:hypothetical protein
MTKSNLSLALLLILFFSLDCYSQTAMNSDVKQTVIKNGIGLGSVVAVVTSWERNKSVLFAIIHGIFSWLYVIYFIVTRASANQH